MNASTSRRPCRSAASNISFIDWGASPHPAATAAPGPVLVSLRAEHPEPQRVRDALSVVGVELPTEPGPRPALIATLRGELGEAELR